MSHRILIVDDEVQLCVSLSRLLKASGYTPIHTTDPRTVLRTLRNERVSLIITDFKMPGMSGIDLIRQIREVNKETPIIMVSGYASVHNVVNAMRYGALNFYEKPVRFAELIKEIDAVLDSASENGGSQGSLDDRRLITENPHMRDRIRLLEKAAPTTAPVLITGESGTGKELAARAIHRNSHRREGPFIKINCAAIPEDLLESELFGFEKGAFTDASEPRAGKLEAAEGGTLFLDEIAEMSPKTQAKILRIIQEQEYERLGSHRTRKMNVRIVAATNRNLQDGIVEGAFREDLYYRLSVIQIKLPALRDRKEDVRLLSRNFLREFAVQYRKSIRGLSQEVEALFLKHDWPGNVRELRNTIERMVIFCEDEEIGMELLPDQYREYGGGDTRIVLQEASNTITKELILNALERTGGSRSRSAEILGITRRTLYNKIKKLGIEV